MPNENEQSPAKTASLWKPYLFLVVATLLANAVAIERRFHSEGNEVPILAALVALCFSQTGLMGLAAIANKNRHRAWALLAIPLVSYLVAMGLIWSDGGQVDFAETVLPAIIFFANALIVIAALGPYRFWRSLRARQQVNRSAEQNDWRFGIRHYLVASIIVAVMASAAKLCGERLLDADWLDIVIFLVSLPSTSILCGILLQEQPLRWQRLAVTVALSLAIGWACDRLSTEHQSIGGVRMNAVQLAVIVPWLCLPRWWADRERQIEDTEPKTEN